MEAIISLTNGSQIKRAISRFSERVTKTEFSLDLYIDEQVDIGDNIYNIFNDTIAKIEIQNSGKIVYSSNKYTNCENLSYNGMPSGINNNGDYMYTTNITFRISRD